ncbi:tripartite tricarboxylate transporter TctB family protein [Desulfovibrio piger]|nr:tripartite tricarboxylate transporter TctB family protein [Desulfovibrio piger]
MHIAEKSDFCSSLILLALMGFCWNESGNIDQGINFALGPLFFPYLLMGLITLCSLILLVRSVGRGRAPASGGAAIADRKTFFYRAALLCLSAAYILALPLGGYAPCTFVYLVAAMTLLGKRAVKSLLIYGVIALCMTCGVQYVFADLLHLFLP